MAPATGSATSAGAPLPARCLAWRLPAIETWPRVVAFAQTFAGRIVLVVAFAGLMKLVSREMWIADHGIWLLTTAAAAAIAMAGRYRHAALAVCTALALLHFPGWFDYSAVHAAIREANLARRIDPGVIRACTLAAFFAIAAACLYCARRYRDHALWRRPVLAQHVVLFCLLGLAFSRSLEGAPLVALWSAITVFSAYFWYLAYAFIGQRQRHSPPVYVHLATFNPLFFTTSVPVGGGAAAWTRVEAGTAEELAVTQLKALKLLVWALILKEAVLRAYRWATYQAIGVPPLVAAFEGYAGGADVSGIAGISGIVANFPERLLVTAIGGHVIVAVARLAGFRLLRNTYRPLSARTIAEFWNRYFYYFKEILVHVYFYPTYLSCFKRHPRLRVAFATFVAAGLGNFLFHFMENHTLARVGLVEGLLRAQTYAFYCAVLAAGIIVSQLRVRIPDPAAPWWRRQLLPSLGVAAFFCLLLVFDTPNRHLTLAHHFRFLLHVFGIGS